MPVHPNRGAIGRAAVIAGVVALLLGACVPIEPVAVVSSSGTTAPVFATDAEALAAAEEAYAAYQAALDYGLATYDASPLEDIAGGSALAAGLESIDRFRESAQRLEGATAVESLTLTAVDLKLGALSAKACIDVSSTQVFDSSGVDITSPGRFDAVSLEVSLMWSYEQSRLLVEIDDVLATGDRCA